MFSRQPQAYYITTLRNRAMSKLVFTYCLCDTNKMKNGGYELRDIGNMNTEWCWQLQITYHDFIREAPLSLISEFHINLTSLETLLCTNLELPKTISESMKKFWCSEKCRSIEHDVIVIPEKLE